MISTDILTASERLPPLVCARSERPADAVEITRKLLS